MDITNQAGVESIIARDEFNIGAQGLNQAQQQQDPWELIGGLEDVRAELEEVEVSDDSTAVVLIVLFQCRRSNGLCFEVTHFEGSAFEVREAFSYMGPQARARLWRCTPASRS